MMKERLFSLRRNQLLNAKVKRRQVGLAKGGTFQFPLEVVFHQTSPNFNPQRNEHIDEDDSGSEKEGAFKTQKLPDHAT